MNFKCHLYVVDTGPLGHRGLFWSFIDSFFGGGVLLTIDSVYLMTISLSILFISPLRFW